LSKKIRREEKVKIRIKLNATSLKGIAITAMLIDHIAWAFVSPFSVLGQLMHVIGRITVPIMCYFIAEGYFHTRSVKKYALRLFAFAIISYLPYILFETKNLPATETFYNLSVIHSLLCALLALWAWDKIENKVYKTLAIIGLCILALPGDGMFITVIYVLIFGINRGNPGSQMKRFAIASAITAVLLNLTTPLYHIPFYSQFYQFGMLLPIPLLMCYNRERGGGKPAKWLFYIFYPAHLLLLALMKIYLT
jgi:hypothetical protein